MSYLKWLLNKIVSTLYSFIKSIMISLYNITMFRSDDYFDADESKFILAVLIACYAVASLIITIIVSALFTLRPLFYHIFFGTWFFLISTSFIAFTYRMYEDETKRNAISVAEEL